jgi:hypothetical protein
MCQKGGWSSFVRSDGSNFRNEGDCTSYGAQGGTYGSPAYLQVVPCSAPPNGVCYGVSGSGLLPGSLVAFSLDVGGGGSNGSFRVGPDGTIDQPGAASFSCQGGGPYSVSAYATGTTASNTPITSPTVTSQVVCGPGPPVP